MLLKIPSSHDIELIEKTRKGLSQKRIIASYNSLNNMDYYNAYGYPLSDIGGTIERPLGTIYAYQLKQVQEEPTRDYRGLLLMGDPGEIEAKGKLEGELPTGERIYTYGTCFLHVNDSRAALSFGYISPESYEDTGRKVPIAISADGEVFYGKVYFNHYTNKNVILLKAENNEFINAEPTEVNGNSINNRNVIVLEESPTRWLVDGDKAITVDTVLMSPTPKDYANSALKTIINSPEYQQSIGVEPTIEKPHSKNPFRTGKLTIEEQLIKSMNIGIIPFLVGPPGVGKTEIVKSQSRFVIHYNMATFTPTSFTGKDYVIPGDVETYIDDQGRQISHTGKALTGSSEPPWLQACKQALEEAKGTNEQVILFLDEFDKLTPALQVFINGIIDEQPTLGGWPIPEGIKIVLAGNTTVDSLASNKISSEVSSRLMTINVIPDVNEWIKWAIKADIDPIVISYIKIHPQDLITSEKGLDGRIDPTISMNPRTWAKKVSKELKEARITGIPLMLENYMSNDQRERFMNFTDEYYNNYIEDILAGTAPLHITDDIGHNTFVVTVLSVITKIEQLQSVLKSIKDNEFKRMFLNNWALYHPDKKVEAYQLVQELQLGMEEVSYGIKR